MTVGKIKGRKRHLLVDTLGWLIAVLMTSAGLDDGVAAPRLLAHVTPADFPRLVVIFADQKYHNPVFEAWLAEHRAVAPRHHDAPSEHKRIDTAGKTLGG